MVFVASNNGEIEEWMLCIKLLIITFYVVCLITRKFNFIMRYLQNAQHVIVVLD